MKRILFVIFLFLIFFWPSTRNFAQQWSTAVNISNMSGRDSQGIIAVDSVGNIHCVWTHFIETWFRKIYYSSSNDEGETWSVPLDISQNNDSVASSPQIAINHLGDIFVSYNLSTQGGSYGVYICKNKDGFWKNQQITNGDYGHKRLISDNNGRIYIILNSGYCNYFMYFENNQWSPILPTYDDTISISEISVGINNHLHFSGYKSLGAGDYSLVYGTYDPLSGIWSQPEIIIDTVNLGTGIALDNLSNPHIIFRDFKLINGDWHRNLFYTCYSGQQWELPLKVGDNSFSQSIFFDSGNNVNIFAMEQDTDTTKIIHTKIAGESINVTTVDSIVSPFSMGIPQAAMFNENLYLVYVMPIGQYESEIFFRKTDVQTYNRHNNAVQSLSLNCYPNPVKTSAMISFSLPEPGEVKLLLFDSKGQPIKVMVERYLQKGDHRIKWDIKDIAGNKACNGLYFLSLQTNSKYETRKIIVVR